MQASREATAAGGREKVGKVGILMVLVVGGGGGVGDMVVGGVGGCVVSGLEVIGGKGFYSRCVGGGERRVHFGFSSS